MGTETSSHTGSDTKPGRAEQREAHLPIGGLFVEALARRDFAAMAECFEPDVRMRAMIPPGPFELNGRDDAAERFRSWFDCEDELELVDATIGEVGPRLYLRWRIRLTSPSGARSRLAEQHVFADAGERIARLDLLCSGWVEQ